MTDTTDSGINANDQNAELIKELTAFKDEYVANNPSQEVEDFFKALTKHLQK